jgi:hypothetical protein
MSTIGGNKVSSGPTQERADLEAAVALGEQAFPKWSWQHTTIDLPQIRKYDRIAIHDNLIDGYMIVAGIAHQPSQGTMQLDLLDEETFERRAQLLALNRQLAKLRGEEDLLERQMKQNSTAKTGGAWELTRPPVIQAQNWTCSAASAAWVLQASGIYRQEQDVVEQLQKIGGINSDQGLLDASMGGLERVMNGYGLTVARETGVSWERLTQIAGKSPAQINGNAWNHHSGLRGFDGTNLQLANPAPGWMGVGQEMSRQQFNNLGPFNVMYVTGRTDGTTSTPSTPNSLNVVRPNGVMPSLSGVNVPALPVRSSLP